MAKLIKANGEITEVTPNSGKHFTLKELQGFVGGYIEFAYPQGLAFKDHILVVNEEGKLDGLPHNQEASVIYGYMSDYIAGNALLCSKDEVE